MTLMAAQPEEVIVNSQFGGLTFPEGTRLDIVNGKVVMAYMPDGTSFSPMETLQVFINMTPTAGKNLSATVLVNGGSAKKSYVNRLMIDWGDQKSDEISASDPYTKTHVYAAAGAVTVTASVFTTEGRVGGVAQQVTILT